MQEQELYKKHRPRDLKAMVGNEDTIRTLDNLLSNGRLPHTILLTGPSGCGKTTIARILRKKLDCSAQDCQEINSADFRGIDTVREINRNMHLAPMMGTTRVWIVDECHKLSNDAQNAFLKALEDTPDHVYFILATTDPGKLLTTIRTRSCELSVQPLSEKELVGLLKRICVREKLKMPDEVVDIIVENSFGSPRMALVLLDKVYSLPESEMIQVVEQEAARQNQAIELARELLKRSPWKVLASIIKNLEDDPEMVRRVVRGYCASVLMGKGKSDTMDRACLIMCEFDDPFFDDGRNKLVQVSYGLTKM